MAHHAVRRATLALLALAAPAAVLAPATAAPAPAAPATSSATSPERPDRPGRPGPADAAYDRALRALTDAGAVGVTAEVVDGRRTWREALGSGSLSPQRPARTDARFRAASVTKMFVSVLALQLVERGTWTLDTTLGEVLPGVWPGREGVTLRQLLSHTSGAPDYLLTLLADATTEDAFLAAVSQRRTDRELVEAARAQPWGFEPGTAYGYSNTNFVLVGMMLARATGESLPRLVERRVLRPARMRDSEFDTTPGIGAPALREYGALGENGALVDLASFDPTMFSGAGALVSTTKDLDRFQLALSTGRLLRPASVRLMRSVVAPPSAPLEYGLGSYRVPDPCTPGRFYYGHDGASFGTLTLSFSSADGSRRLALSMTGRQYTEAPPTFAALAGFLETFIGAPCGKGPATSSTAALGARTTGVPFADALTPLQVPFADR